MKITILAAMARNRVIGNDGKLPWNLPSDLKRFRSRTMGHVVVMGHRTWESIGGPLEGRVNVVLSRRLDFQAEGAITASSLAEALEVARTASETRGTNEIFIIGGGEVFEETIGLADRIELTEVDGDFVGDVYFPVIDRRSWLEVSRFHVANLNERPHDVVVFERARS